MKKILDYFITGISAAIMLFFAIPKLLGKEQSRAGFKEFGAALSIDADLFRIFTGIAESGIAVLLILFIITKKNLHGRLAFGFLLVTMISAIGLEFYARAEVKPVLVVIAVVLSIFSIYRLKTI
ncbi:hypothetical protein [Algoriphagus aquimarinus]|uniref:DoxX-like family protein n=1 Tax=Algoriphagus aquimarinus TaxID=237018 RepID=A0A1I0VZ45_9BACT|nr:hypothetical protein [Algoriphagus aquimarinus]SFA81699.1 hypothetical protein SAMN04489723_101464 [Algoriphagus aquimarinus]